METLNKTIKKLNDAEYQELLSAVAGRKNNKPYLVLESARKNNYDETQMMELLQVNPSTYYTLKSRVSEILLSICAILLLIIILLLFAIIII